MIGETEIAAILGMNPETIRPYLRSLEQLGMVTRIHHFQGWILTAYGCQIIQGESLTEAPDDPSREDGTSAVNPRPGKKIPLSLARRNYQVYKKDNRTARGKARSGPLVQANLEAFASIGLAKNDY